jgi:exosortase F-associated protein
MTNKRKVLLLIGCAFGIVLIRLFEDQLFYDPFLQFFKQDFKNKTLPNFDVVKLFFGILFRYSLNTIFSLAILYLLFPQRSLLKFSTQLFVLFFVVLSLLFFGFLFFFTPDYMILFYLRRFLIQPLLLILFIPAFYYQQLSK